MVHFHKIRCVDDLMEDERWKVPAEYETKAWPEVRGVVLSLFRQGCSRLCSLIVRNYSISNNLKEKVEGNLV